MQDFESGDLGSNPSRSIPIRGMESGRLGDIDDKFIADTLWLYDNARDCNDM
jgi:hypothetical protein